MFKNRKILIPILCSLPLVSACATEVPVPPPTPVSSHSETYMRELRAGRVAVYHYTDLPKYKNIAQAVFYSRDGKVFTCWFDLETKNYKTGTGWVWKVVSQPQTRTEIKVWRPAEKKEPQYGVPFTYNPVNGIYSPYNWDGDNNKWIIRSENWYQETWPVAFTKVCPDLPLPADLPINQKQTSLDWYELRKQDPDAIIKNFRASNGEMEDTAHLHGPKAPTRSVAEAKGWLIEHNGNVLLKDGGGFFLHNQRAEPLAKGILDGAQVWELDEDYRIVDVARLDVKGSVLRYHWENRVPAVLDLAAIEIPLQPIKRHPAFAFTDWLVESSSMKRYAFERFDAFYLQLMAGGVAWGAPAGFDPLEGRWHLDGDQVIVVITNATGKRETLSRPWSDLARQAGWPGLNDEPEGGSE